VSGIADPASRPDERHLIRERRQESVPETDELGAAEGDLPQPPPKEKPGKSPPGKKATARKASEEEKWVVGGLAVTVPAAAFMYRQPIESWLAENWLWLIGIAVLVLGSCVAAMMRRHRANRRPKKKVRAAPEIALDMEPPAPAREPVPGELLEAREGALETPVPSSAVAASPVTASSAAAATVDEAPALIAALKLDYGSVKARTVRRARVELGVEWVIELPPAGVYGDLASKAHRIISWWDVDPERFTVRPGATSRQVVLLALDEPLYSRVPSLPDPREAEERGVLPVGYDMHGSLTEIESPVGVTHMLVAGSTGGGKTEELKWLAYFAIVNGWDLILVDGKGDGDFAYLERACRIYEENPDHGRMMEILDFVEQEHLQRAAANSASVRSGAGKIRHRPVLFIIDEISTYTDEASNKNKEDFQRKLKTVSRKARSSRMLAVLATQNPKAEVIDTGIRGNARVRIALGCADSTQSNVILGSGTASAGHDASKLPDVPGAGILQVKDRNRQMRGLMVSDEELNAAVDERLDRAKEDREDLPEAARLALEAYGEDEFLSTVEFASRLRHLGVEIPGGDDPKLTGAAVTEWLTEQFGQTPPAVRKGDVRGRLLSDIVRL
jgi:S-DNA-T family DNA segregation ATPase FtsK/SpoIIIE